MITNATTTKNNSNLIGLLVGSRVFYCHRSTLANNAKGSYLDRRFGLDRHFEADTAYYLDSNGIPVFFIERDGDLFVHVLRYLTKLKLNLPTYQSSKELWRDLRDEAEFYGLDGMLHLLQATHSCPFTTNSENTMQGIFYWLGTGRGSREVFENPLLARERNPAAKVEVTVGTQQEDDFFMDDKSILSSPLLQHRQPTAVDCHQNMVNSEQQSAELYRFANQGHVPLSKKQPFPPDACKVPLIIHLSSIWIRPTHISLRVSFELLEEKTPIFLEASRDGRTWDRLALEATPLERAFLSRTDLFHRIDSALRNGPDEVVRRNCVVDLAEAYLRKHWRVEATTTYYNYFRFCYRNGRHTSLAGVAMEMFGDIQEE